MQNLRITATVIWFCVLTAAGIYVYMGGSLVEDIKYFVARWPEYSLLLFLIAYAIRPVLFIPDSIMVFIAGATFGPWLGFVAAYIGENMSALIAFTISRFLGNSWVSHSHLEFVRKLDRVVTRRGFKTLMFLRLIPIAPFDPINYGAGLTSMSYRTFIAGTALGVVPALTVYVVLGSSVTNPKLLIVAAILTAFICIKLFAMRSVAPDVYALGWHHHSRKK
jgi:uncharacterized membrane protein YdjX (TVP38/TMEM64 family)